MNKITIHTDGGCEGNPGPGGWAAVLEYGGRTKELSGGEPVPAGHPMDAKKQLARRIVERYHGADAGQAALADFNTRFSKRDLASAELPILSLSGLAGDIVSVVVAGYAQCFQITKSRGDARRLVEQGSVQLREEKITDPKAAPAFQPGDVLKLDKTRAVRIG